MAALGVLFQYDTDEWTLTWVGVPLLHWQNLIFQQISQSKSNHSCLSATEHCITWPEWLKTTKTYPEGNYRAETVMCELHSYHGGADLTMPSSERTGQLWVENQSKREKDCVCLRDRKRERQHVRHPADSSIDRARVTRSQESCREKESYSSCFERA